MVVKDHRKPLKTDTLRGMCKQVGIDPNDLQGVQIKATRSSHPIALHKEHEGGYSVTFPDFHEAFTDGDTFAETVAEAADCVEEALARFGKRLVITVEAAGSESVGRSRSGV